MNKFEGMLFCTDLDGTLYADDKTVSKENLDAIEYFKSQGGRFTFITGRVPLTSKKICDQLRPNAPFGCINGAGIFDPQKNEYLMTISLNSQVTDLLREVDQRLPDVGFQLNTEQTIYFCKDNEAMQIFRRNTGLPNVVRAYEDVTEPILKVVFGHTEDERIRELQALLTSHPKEHLFDFIRSEFRLFEILPKGASKGTVLCRLAEALGIRQEKTIAVGDYHNDISMIRQAGLGIAVANAVDEAKAVADYVTVSNNESAIATIVGLLDRGELSI